MVPLSSYGKPYTPPPAKVDANLDMKTGTRDQVVGMSIEDYFTYLAKLMKTIPLGRGCPHRREDGTSWISAGTGL